MRRSKCVCASWSRVLGKILDHRIFFLLPVYTPVNFLVSWLLETCSDTFNYGIQNESGKKLYEENMKLVTQSGIKNNFFPPYASKTVLHKHYLEAKKYVI